ncbi:Protein O-mannosyltransferase 2 [Coemansia sp. Benny D115]|nr:Protein O-mannosyltransferase 2 [Coemansia sp. Benny D115]
MDGRYSATAQHRATGFAAYPLAEREDVDEVKLEYPSTQQQRRRRRPWWVGAPERTVLIALTLFAAFTKLYRIGRRDNVTWDEAHFGKFGAYYLNRTFYHDVHPPLAKMLVGLSELMAGHNGTFRFEGGHTYPAYVNYVFMRIFNAMFGIALTPMAYATCRQLRMPVAFAVLAALFVTLDNAICVMSRFILLDAPLLAFTALAGMMLAHYQRRRTHAFTTEWWRYLILTGVALGLVASAKWVGMFAVALVGLHTLWELFELFCDARMPARTYARHWAARAGALIVVPLTIYAACFWVHFAVLNRYDGSANFMPLGFQVRLRGNPLARQPYDVQTGSAIRLQSGDGGFGYLHSHEHKYPTGSQRQQVTGYGYADGNNYWAIERRLAAGDFSDASDAKAAAKPIAGYIAHGDLVAMRHNSTGTYLYSEKQFAAPVRDQYLEVSTVAGDSAEASYANALWIVEIVSAEKRMRDGRVHPLGTKLRLRNLATRCVLHSTGGRLDKDWGWGQSEVGCDASSENNSSGSALLWTVERHVNRDLARVNLGQHMSSSFWHAFGVLNRQMWLTNNALVPDPDKHNVLESSPTAWPLLTYPMRMVGWDDRSIKYLEVGNPLLWWASATACLLFPVQLLWWLASWRRNHLAHWRPAEFREYIEGALLLWGGWALHYLPFFLMGRVTYLHHYLPALYFALLFLAYQLHHATAWYLRPGTRTRVLYATILVTAAVFWWFSPLTYGWDKPIKELHGMQWAASWPVYEDPLDL